MDFGWVKEYNDVDSIANLALRKTDLLNYAIFNEGNLYNNLFYKVDKKLKESCDSGGDYCQFHFWFLEHMKTLENQDWVAEHDYLFLKSGGEDEYYWDDDLQEYVYETSYDVPKLCYKL